MRHSFITPSSKSHFSSIQSQNMENKKSTNFIFVIIAVVTGIKLYEKFDGDILNFDEPLSSIIYLIYALGFLASICGLIINYKNRVRK